MKKLFSAGRPWSPLVNPPAEVPAENMNTNPQEPIIILGLAGTRALINSINHYYAICRKKKLSAEKKIIICRHAFSISTKEEPQPIGHNSTIENEELYEKEYYDLITKLRSEGFDVVSFTQSSKYGNSLISRYSGVKLSEHDDGPRSVFESNPYSSVGNKDSIEQQKCDKINEELALIFNDFLINNNYMEFVLKCFRDTHCRKGYYGCFLHDVKVYFVSSMINELMEKKILQTKDLYIYENKVYDYQICHDANKVTETIVDPLRIDEYSQLFNEWLSSFAETQREESQRQAVVSFAEEEPFPPSHFKKKKKDSGVTLNPLVNYVITDPGPGHKLDRGQHNKLIHRPTEIISQDVDDVITLLLIPHIDNIVISDETSILSRTSFVLDNFSEKFNMSSIFIQSNDSVEYARWKRAEQTRRKESVEGRMHHILSNIPIIYDIGRSPDRGSEEASSIASLC